jgi:hypothetical protein
MSLVVHYAPWFDADLHLRIAWYAEQGVEGLPDRLVMAVQTTVAKLLSNPRRGRSSLSERRSTA